MPQSHELSENLRTRLTSTTVSFSLLFFFTAVFCETPSLPMACHPSCHGYGRACVDGKRYTGTPSRWGRQQPIPPRHVFVQPKKWVKNEVVWLKAVMPEAGCRTIVHYFSRRWKSRRQMTVSKPYVTDICRCHEYLSLTARRKLKHRISRPMPNNCVWGV